MIDLSTQLTVIVTTSPIPTHPSTQIIDETIESFLFFDTQGSVKVILANDACHPDASDKVRDTYANYLDKIAEKYSTNEKFKIIQLKNWGCLAGNIFNAIKVVETPYVLIVQHDFKFVEEIAIKDCIEAMNAFEHIKHIRFNRQANYPYVFDCDPKKRIKNYREESYKIQAQSRELTLIKTLGWSDNNHLCKTKYYRDVVSKLIGKRRTFPEHPCNLASDKILHKLFGTYIYGGLGKEGVIQHLDGRGTRSIEIEFEETSEKTQAVRDHLMAAYKLNVLRIKVGFERGLYRLIAYWLLFRQRFF